MDSIFKSYTDRITNLVPSILGYRLRPFSLGHSILLKAVDSKFITGEYNGFLDINNIFGTFKTDTTLLSEFILAVLICSTSYDDFKEECNSGKITNTIKEFLNDVKGKELNLLKEIHIFAHYLKNGTNAPLYEVKEKDSSSTESNPLEVEESIISSLMQECGYSREESINLPFTETLTAYLIYAHRNGGIELISKDVYELQMKLKGSNGKS